ncbi:MAG: hypothetical protein Q9O62_08045 [Ardenticatenia bacterium]|nr:hypothetical protein [Ardenticatenia bacterium]
MATRRYWHPRPDRVRLPTPGQAREHAEHLRRLLLRHLSATWTRQAATCSP